MRLNTIKTADKEVPEVRKVIESEHKNPQQLFASLKAKAPKLTEFLKIAYTKGVAEFHASSKKLSSSAQHGLTQVSNNKKLHFVNITFFRCKTLFASPKKESNTYWNQPILPLKKNLDRCSIWWAILCTVSFRKKP